MTRTIDDRECRSVQCDPDDYPIEISLVSLSKVQHTIIDTVSVSSIPGILIATLIVTEHRNVFEVHRFVTGCIHSDVQEKKENNLI